MIPLVSNTIVVDWLSGLVVEMGSNPGGVIPKALKMGPIVSWFDTQHLKVGIGG